MPLFDLTKVGVAFAQISIFTLLVESLTQVVTVPVGRWTRWPVWGDQAVAVFFSVGSCLLFRVNAFDAIGLPTNITIAQILTGAIVSRGSHVWHDLTTKIAPSKE